jgi:hypothetical protein
MTRRESAAAASVLGGKAAGAFSSPFGGLAFMAGKEKVPDRF